MRGAGWILLGVAALWMSQLPLVSSHPTCSVSQQLDGSFKYELSEPHDSTCDTSWRTSILGPSVNMEEAGLMTYTTNKVIARNSDRDDTLVQALTNQSITMKTCYDFLLHRAECSGVQVMTNCSVNCTRLPEQSQNKSDPVNPDLICFTVDRCLDPVTFGLCVFAVAVVITVVVCLCIYKPRCESNLNSPDLKSSRPQESRPQESRPEESRPEESRPEGSRPEGSRPKEFQT
ncbi:unnamed protein product [Pleuronectes platessa]|uniref:Uncharacterized protein n=1 Tax=Pleuronectes platessa TaxID=8262 RepID=A0A9N7YZV4_PLEPL|nr:unnamed protein product [Pleuronectes platessa]